MVFQGYKEMVEGITLFPQQTCFIEPRASLGQAVQGSLHLIETKLTHLIPTAGLRDKSASRSEWRHFEHRTKVSFVSLSNPRSALRGTAAWRYPQLFVTRPLIQHSN